MAARLGLPSTAAVVSIKDFLDPDLRDSWEHPGARVLPDSEQPYGYFAVDVAEWRRAVRRMARCGLVRSVPPCTARSRDSAGAFAVLKSEAEDRLIADRRPRNGRE